MSTDSLLSRISQLEEENKSLLDLNEMFQEELKQKTKALEKSTIDYTKLKSQYEELLLRVTELHQENMAFNTPTSTPPASPHSESNSLFESLQNQIDQLGKRKNALKLENQALRQQLQNEQDKANQLELENQNYLTQFQLYKKLISQNVPILSSEADLSSSNHSWDFIIISTQNLLKLYKTEVEKHKKTKTKLQHVLNKCELLAKEVEQNRNALEIRLNQQKKRKTQSQLEIEIQELACYLKKYEKKCQIVDS